MNYVRTCFLYFIFWLCNMWNGMCKKYWELVKNSENDKYVESKGNGNSWISRGANGLVKIHACEVLHKLNDRKFMALFLLLFYVEQPLLM